VDDISFIVTHQANLHIIETVVDTPEIHAEIVCTAVDNYGKIPESSCIIAMDSLITASTIEPGSTVMFLAFGAGLSWGAAILKF
jgi:3-oxoacyl-[acyl-carrier-protein] synthase-3